MDIPAALPDPFHEVKRKRDKKKEGLTSTKHIMDLISLAIYNISYIRGLFPESYFEDARIPLIDLEIKKLKALDEESHRLIDWMEKGVYDALRKKVLKTIILSVFECEKGPVLEEYRMMFTYLKKSDGILMTMNLAGNMGKVNKIETNATQHNSNQIRICACEMIRESITFMLNLNEVPNERAIAMKLLYYDDNGNACSPLPNRYHGYFLCTIRDRTFYFDSGASWHLCGNRDFFSELYKLPQKSALRFSLQAIRKSFLKKLA